MRRHRDVIAPSLIPTKPGGQRKHGRRLPCSAGRPAQYDAAQLARLYRAGELTAVRIPREAEERVRDVVRWSRSPCAAGQPARETFQREVIKSRHDLLKFLARRGFIYRKGTNWRRPHRRWSQQLATDSSPLAPEDRLVFREYLALVEYTLQRRDELDRRLEALALTPALKDAVGRLQCFRGISVPSAMGLATELVDWRRFTSPRELAAYLGLGPTERSSRDRERTGSLTTAGNSPCRHALVQAAWSYRDRPNLRVEITARPQGQPPAVAAHAGKAQQRWHARWHARSTHLTYRQQPPIAVVAVARELIGFLGAVTRELEPSALPATAPATAPATGDQTRFARPARVDRVACGRGTHESDPRGRYVVRWCGTAGGTFVSRRGALATHPLRGAPALELTHG